MHRAAWIHSFLIVRSRQEDHYRLDRLAGSTGQHYYAAVNTGLTKRNLSRICLSLTAESGSSRLRWVVAQHTRTHTHTLHPPTTPTALMPVLSPDVQSFFFFSLSLCLSHQRHTAGATRFVFLFQKTLSFFVYSENFIMHLKLETEWSSGMRYVIVPIFFFCAEILLCVDVMTFFFFYTSAVELNHRSEMSRSHSSRSGSSWGSDFYCDFHPPPTRFLLQEEGRGVWFVLDLPVNRTHQEFLAEEIKIMQQWNVAGTKKVPGFSP